MISYRGISGGWLAESASAPGWSLFAPTLAELIPAARADLEGRNARQGSGHGTEAGGS